jgi:thiamine-phosphate pyrophosphorylase
MMTDERQGDGLIPALARLPRGAGVVFRHYGLPLDERRALFEKVRRIARRRGLVLVAAAPDRLCSPLRVHGVHNDAGRAQRYAAAGTLRTAAVHNMRELRRAERNGANLVFLSPIFPTRSHPGAASLGPLRFGVISRKSRLPVVALGGMDPARARRLKGHKVHGWAAIDAWS